MIQFVFFPITIAPPTPSGIIVTRINDTTIRVSWQPLSLVEARGHIMYHVIVTPTTGSRRRRQATQEERVCTVSLPCEVPANDSNVIVGGLDQSTSYSVTVNAVNSEGEAGPTFVSRSEIHMYYLQVLLSLHLRKTKTAKIMRKHNQISLCTIIHHTQYPSIKKRR